MADLRQARTFLHSDVFVDCWKVGRRSFWVWGGIAERFRIRKDVYILYRGNEQGVEIIALVHNAK